VVIGMPAGAGRLSEKRHRRAGSNGIGGAALYEIVGTNVQSRTLGARPEATTANIVLLGPIGQQSRQRSVDARAALAVVINARPARPSVGLRTRISANSGSDAKDRKASRPFIAAPMLTPSESIDVSQTAAARSARMCRAARNGR